MHGLLLVCTISLQFIAGQSTAGANGCSKVVCPEQLICSPPKSPIYFADRNSPCCNITVCTCQGTDNELSISVGTKAQYEALKDRYTNCTLVNGNLELIGLEDYTEVKTEDNKSIIDFTKNVQQVTGYVLISRVFVDYIDLSSLRLIRGSKLYGTNAYCKEKASNASDSLPTSGDSHGMFALHVTETASSHAHNKGLKELWMPKLTEITRGDVIFSNNDLLCHVMDVLWEDEILQTLNQNVTFKNNSLNCTECPRSCQHGKLKRPACWGNSSELCQIITRTNCINCGKRNRCGAENKICCNDRCSAGCFESEDIHCHECKDFNNDGKCVDNCPHDVTKDPPSGKVKNPEELKFQFARYCVKSCPDNVPEDGKFCSVYCSEGSFDYGSNKCEKCPNNGACSNICAGIGAPYGNLTGDTYINKRNIKNFNKNCTIIEGSLFFRGDSYSGDQYCEMPGITDAEVFEAFQNVEEITGFLAIDHWTSANLCVFKNLKKIRGKELVNDRYALTVYTDKSPLKELCLNSLESVNGGIWVVQNNLLCFNPTGTHWNQFITESWFDIEVYHNKNISNCAPCHEQCREADGCWGRSNTQCVKCKHFTDLTDANGLLTDPWVPDPHNESLIYPGHNVSTCVEKCDFNKGVYGSAQNICLPCDTQCEKTCVGPGPSNCTRCKNVTLSGMCLPKCPGDHYTASNLTCHACVAGCLGGCVGPLDDYDTASGCNKCHFSSNSRTGEITYRGRRCEVCTRTKIKKDCPDGCITINNTGMFECYKIPTPDYTVAYVLCSIVAVIIAAVVVYKCWRHRRTINRMRKAIGETMLAEHLPVDGEAAPLTPSGAAPNQAQLRLVKDSELVIGKLLGTGAFGEVHKAVWSPLNIEGEKVKIAVAVKTLKALDDMTQEANTEIMNEAYMMASVECVYLVRLLGIRLTQPVSLITQLMPLGSLLEYVRDTKNQDNIHSRQMLNWFIQIAKGMLYLQEKHLVHRDLAARNILVKTPNHVKITDFGLAKMLSEDTYQAEGGKLPIKWLAIECIRERRFSHLSDVWAYGITCWELLTFGAKPYEGVRAVNMLDLLEKGERLHQPSAATIEVYMILIKCWMVDRVCRPSFADLVSEFTSMVMDPTRYIVIKDHPGNCFSPNSVDEQRFFEQLMEEEKMDEDIITDEPDDYLLGNAVVNSNDQPYYANHSAVSKEAHTQPSNNGPERLFSRSTPSAVIDPLAASSTSTERARDSDLDTLVRINSTSDQDDVFSEAASSSKAIAHGAAAVDSQNNRKDSEETQRYTDDPTSKRNNAFERGSIHSKQGKAQYDENDYLLPTTSQAPVYFDPEADTDPLLSKSSLLMNDTYVDSPPLSDDTQPGAEYGHIASCREPDQPAYVNTGGEAVSPSSFSNEEYMATDSGIGDDTQSILSRNNTGKRNPRKTSSRSSADENERLTIRDGEVRFKPDHTSGLNGQPREGKKLWSTSSDGSSASGPSTTAMNNPEYMLLNQSGENAQLLSKEQNSQV